MALALNGACLGSAAATPDDLTAGFLIAHHCPESSPYSYNPPAGGWCADYAPHAINRLDDVNAQISPQPPGTVWYVLAAWGYEDKTWCGTEFGFGNFDTSVQYFIEWAPCFPGAGLEIPTSGWPGPNEGTAFVTTSTPWHGDWIPVYYFASYVYDAGYGATIIPISVDPPTGFCGFSNCENPPRSFNVYGDFRGAMGVNMPGIVPSPWPPGYPWACCLPVVPFCLMVYEQDCVAMGGEWHQGTACDPNPCPLPGACCIGEVCEVRFEEDCGLLGGEFQGPETACEPNPCLPEGACCIGGICEILTEEVCGLLEGVWTQGAGCEPNPCRAVCCFDSDCVVTLQADCVAGLGFWHPEWTTCEPNPCDVYSPAESATWGRIKNLYR